MRDHLDTAATHGTVNGHSVCRPLNYVLPACDAMTRLLSATAIVGRAALQAVRLDQCVEVSLATPEWWLRKWSPPHRHEGDPGNASVAFWTSGNASLLRGRHFEIREVISYRGNGDDGCA
jgi:hypothetical protein